MYSRYKHVKEVITRVLCASLLFSYLLGWGYTSLIHPFEHEHKIVHSFELESDPCHRAIYHDDVLNGCHHEFHFTEQEEDCTLCDARVLRGTISKNESFDVLKHFEKFIFVDYNTGPAKKFYSHKKSRGPPQFS